jgi:serine/threonine-protein kinase HipA
MRDIHKIHVSLQFTSEEIDVGELVLADRKIYFKFFPRFLELNLDISPFKLKRSLDVQTAEMNHFDGLFGVFGDSLPDGWGRLLTDRRLISQGIPLHSVNALQRLAFIGKKGRGALNYRPILLTERNFTSEIHLDDLANASLRILEGEPEKKLDMIRNMGGSSGGARPKIQVLYDAKNNVIVPDNFPSKKEFESWIIKFPNSTDFIDAAQIEYAYYLMAQDAGIEMTESKLFATVKGNAYFGTKRFDRNGNKRMHMISAAGLMHDNYRLSNLDYGHLMDAAFRLEKDIRGYEKIFRIAVFNVFMHNRDDHSKNFSYLMDETGKWRCAPAYDLTFSFSSHGWHSTSVAGESQFPGINHLLKLANSFQLRNATEIINHAEAVAADWKKYAKEAGVKKESQNYIAKILEKTLKK